MNRRGFTAIELILVVAIMAVLLTLSVVNLRSSQANARDTERKADVATIAQHLENYFTSGTDGSAAIGNYPSTALTADSTTMKQILRDVDVKSLTAPGATDPTFQSATNNDQTTNGVRPQPASNNDIYVYQPLHNDGSLCITSSLSSIEVSVVAGGGGGGGFGGGGGAGGIVYKPAFPVGPQLYTVTVGSGGAGAIYNSGVAGTTGNNSTFSTITAAGGGGGGTRLSSYVGSPGGAGGSGGGGSPSNNTTLGAGGAANPSGQGFMGGTEIVYGWGGSGGGGAGGVGAGGYGINGGDGGVGIVNPITGSTAGQLVNGVYFLGGGGGGATYNGGTGTAGVGGYGGGGAGSRTAINGTPGTSNTGGGGGGGDAQGTVHGGAGGSGIVIVRYLTGTMTATGGTITTSGLYTIHTFTNDGSFVVTTSTPACSKFNLYYWSEVDNSVHMIKSKNQ